MPLGFGPIFAGRFTSSLCSNNDRDRNIAEPPQLVMYLQQSSARRFLTFGPADGMMIAAAGGRTYEHGRGFALWVAQIALNFAWTPAFFLLHRPALALCFIAALLAVILVFIVTRWTADRVSALLFVPYAAWVAFATLLNASIVVLN